MAYPRTAIPRHDLILVPFTILFLTLSSSSARLLLNKTPNTTTSKVVGDITDCDGGCCNGLCNPKRNNTMKPDGNTRPLAVNKTEDNTNTTEVNGVSALTIGGCDNGGCSGGGVGIGISVPMPRISIPFPSINVPGISIGPGISIPGVSIGGGGSSTCSGGGSSCYETPPCNNPPPSAPPINPTPTPSPSVNPTPSPYIPVNPTPTPSPSVNPTPCHNCIPAGPHCPNCNPVAPSPPSPSQPCAPPHHCEGVYDMDELLQLNGTTNNQNISGGGTIIDQDDDYLQSEHPHAKKPKLSRVDVKNPMHIVKPKSSGELVGTDGVGGGRVIHKVV